MVKSTNTLPPGIQFTNVSSRWSLNGELTLNAINLNIKPGSLVAIIGPVGAGKSSLIQAILGELPILSGGSISSNGNISYASQEPWIFSGSIRTNIIFGQKWNAERYNVVLRNCALEKDLRQFADGDRTIVGERGHFLSGGQKARISLARACYRTATIYLLDDPLSAVDTHIGRHLFDTCVRELLRDRIVVLVTHQLHYLQCVDKIVILNKGKVEAIGSYESLRESGLNFAKLLADPVDKQAIEDGQTYIGNVHGPKENERDKESRSVEEKRSNGSIPLSVYRQYCKACGGFCSVFVIVMFCVFAQFMASSGDCFLSYW